MSNIKTFDLKESKDANFKNLLKVVDDNLNKAIFSFTSYFKTDINDFLFKLKYDYESLQVTTIYNVLNLLSIEYAEKLPQSKIKEAMPHISNDIHATSDDRNRRRVERIKNTYDKRNETHLNYFNLSDFTPKTLVTDALWYDVLSDFPMLKRFLFEEEAIVTKAFFDMLNSVYKKINERSGYDRFYLLYKLEMSSKLEFFYKVLSLIKKEKRRLKLIDKDVQNLISNMYYLHTVPIGLSNKLVERFDLKNNIIYNEILQCSPEQQTTNNIIFNIDNLAIEYVKETSRTISFIQILNHILYATVYHLTNQVTEELHCLKSKECFHFINGIQQCSTSTKYFDSYIRSHNLINLDKDCCKDITFQHFKKIYKIKK